MKTLLIIILCSFFSTINAQSIYYKGSRIGKVEAMAMSTKKEAESVAPTGWRCNGPQGFSFSFLWRIEFEVAA